MPGLLNGGWFTLFRLCRLDFRYDGIGWSFLMRFFVGMLMLCGIGAAAGTGEEAVDFARDIRPIFKSACYNCHGVQKHKAALRLDVKKLAFAGGESGVAIVPGKSSASLLIKRVSSETDDERMPPRGDRLSGAQVTLLRRWIDAGAVWPDGLDAAAPDWREWWSLRPLSRPAVPDGAANPIDAFVRKTLS